MTVVAQSWSELEREGRRETGWHVRRIFPDAFCELLAGLRQPDRAPGLLLELDLEQVPPDLVLPKSAGFTVDPVLVGGGERRVRFALSLADPAWRAIFGTLCDDVAGAAALAVTPRAALREWTGRLSAWQAFMARHGAQGLSEMAALGLLGELLVLRDQLVPRAGLAAALAMWTGPRGEPNDFSLPHGFAEVKTTSRQAPDSLQITNADQLDDARGRIALVHMRMLPDAAGVSLTDAAVSLQESYAWSAPLQLNELNRALMASGYLPDQATLYGRTYRVDRVDIYEVQGTFPRVTRSDLRNGVRNCSYVIELASCASSRADETLLDQLMGGTHG